MFVCIEGIDASGKATQSKLLAEKLGAKLFSFPDYNTPIGHLIKGHLKRYWSALPSEDHGGGVPEGSGCVDLLNAFVFQALQLTNRMEHASVLRKLQDDGEHIVVDRYWPSGWVYGQADGLRSKWLLKIQEVLPCPDLYLLLDIAPDQSVKRRPERRDRYETQEGLMDQVVHLYRCLWREQGVKENTWVVINGQDTIEGVHWQVMAAIERQVDRLLYPKNELPWWAAS